MKRILTGVGLCLLLAAGSGCRDKGIILPTDEEARRRAEPEPPPPIAFGGPPGPPPKAEQAPTGAPNKVNTQGVK